MIEKAIFIARLRKSLSLQDPSIEIDEAYKYTDDELWDITEQAVLEHNGEYTLTSIPSHEVHFILMLCKKEIYFHLATATAPFYPIKAEGAELRKDVRFDHYIKLVSEISKEYANTWNLFSQNMPMSKEGGNQGETFIQSRHYSTRTIQQAKGIPINLVIDKIESTSLCLSWDKFNVIDGQFSQYNVYYSTQPIYDKYDNVVSTLAVKSANIADIHRNIARISNLQPNTLYYVLVSSEDMNGIKSYDELSATTL